MKTLILHIPVICFYNTKQIKSTCNRNILHTSAFKFNSGLKFYFLQSAAAVQYVTHFVNYHLFNGFACRF